MTTLSHNRFSTSQGNRIIMAKWEGAGQWGAFVHFSGVNKYSYVIRQGGVNKIAVSSSLYNDSAWHSVFAYTDGSNTRLYIDAGTEDITGTAYASIDSTTLNVRMGNYGAQTINGFIGQIGFFVVWEDVIIPTAQMDAISRGVYPFIIQNSSIVFFMYVSGNNSPEAEWISQNNGTVTGTTKFAGNPPVQLLSRYMSGH